LLFRFLSVSFSLPRPVAWGSPVVQELNHSTLGLSWVGFCARDVDIVVVVVAVVVVFVGVVAVVVVVNTC